MNKKDLVYRSFVYKVLAISMGVVLVYIFFKFLFAPFLPFILGYSISLVMKPILLKISQKNSKKRKFLSAFLLLLLLFFVITLLYLIGKQLFHELYQAVAIDQWIADLENEYSKLDEWFTIRFPNLSEKIDSDEWSDALLALLSKATDHVSGFLTRAAFSIPDAIFFLFAVVLSCYYFLSEKDLLSRFLKLFINEKHQKDLKQFSERIKNSLKKYMKAGGLLFSITFTELLFGFLFLKMHFPFMFAFLVAFVDFLPFFGTGAILVPLALIKIITKDLHKGIGLLMLWICTYLTRQIAEPKIMGKEMGIHPLLVLFSTYIGFHFFGITGLIVLPLAVSVFWDLFICSRKEYPMK